MGSLTGTDAFRAARDFLLTHREDHTTAYEKFRWPRMSRFNWALDWFDVIARGEDRTALWIMEPGGGRRWSYADLSHRSDQVANWLRTRGVAPGDRLVLMLGNQVELWETVLAAMKLRAVIIPTTTLLGPDDLADRIRRGAVRHVIAGSSEAVKFAGVDGGLTRVAVGEPVDGWLSYSEAYREDATFVPDGDTHADDPLLLYFTSGTTARPKLVEHSHVSYPVGHLSTMYWLGLEPGDTHLNISSPGWGKHAWSNVFGPWNAEATAVAFAYPRFDAGQLLDELERCPVTSFCAPPTVWRMLLQADLGRLRTPPRKLVSAGEPLNPEVIERVREAWGVTVRDGFGQTETTAQVGNSPGQKVKAGSMGRPLPGYPVALVDPTTGRPGDSGEICLDLSRRPVGLMTGYRDDPELTGAATAGGYYHTGDLASRDAEGYLTYVGRTDDVFKASDYLVSPFELENVLLEHEAVADAAVVPSPDPVRLAVPKAYVMLAPGWQPTADTARSIFAHCRGRLAPYLRVRRLEFADLPKTVSGKIRRTELRAQEHAGHALAAARPAGEYREEDLR